MTAMFKLLNSHILNMDIEELLKTIPFIVDGYTITSNDGDSAIILIKCHDEKGGHLQIEAKYIKDTNALEFLGII
jgi:hypothetical protein